MAEMESLLSTCCTSSKLCEISYFLSFRHYENLCLITTLSESLFFFKESPAKNINNEKANVVLSCLEND